MYDIKYECRYHMDNVFIDTDNVTENERDIVRDILYKEDLLNIFGIDDNNENDIFGSIISQLYEKLKNCPELRECMRLSALKVMSENEETGLCILYSYDFMYLTHSCVSYYLENKKIPKNEYQLLKDKI
jgi:hypothetical protein